MASVQTHTKMLDELLDYVNNAEDVLLAMKGILTLPYVRQYMELSVSKDFSTLDIENITYKVYDYDRAIAGAMLLCRQTWNIVNSVIMAENVNLKTKEFQYKSLKEMLYSKESDVLTGVLTKNITELYPNITFELINEALYGTN